MNSWIVLIYYTVFLAALAWVSVRDIRTHRIPNSFVLGLFLYGEFSVYVRTLIWEEPCVGLGDMVCCILDAILGSLLGGGLLLLVSMATKGGFGGGDIKLMAVLGFVFGLQGTLAALLIALIVVLWVGLVRRKYSLEPVRIPFAPCLFFGCLVAAYFYIWSRCL